MASLVQLYEEYMSYSDPRVKNWIFMSSPWPTLLMVVVYLVLVLAILPAYMKNRKPFNLTQVIRCYNIIQIFACLTIIYRMATSGWTTGDYGLGCEPVDYSNNPKPVRMAGMFYWFYILKIVELSETVFFLLRKKFNQVSGLHVYHHASTMCMAWIGCNFVAGGMVSIPIMVNSFIHVLMYSYYYLSSLGPKWQKKLAPWKPKLTLMQMIQFTALIIHSLSVLKPGCKVPWKMLFIYIPNIVVIYKMFYDFYQNAYNKKRT